MIDIRNDDDLTGLLTESVPKESIEAILGYITREREYARDDGYDAGYDANSEHDKVREVEVPGARVRVERVEAYGLRIGVDAGGRAATVEFPDGAQVVAQW